jgi:acetolactate synthase-1/2/3 large subunit
MSEIYLEGNMSVAEAIVLTLEKLGIEYIFIQPGSQILPLVRTIDKSKLKHIGIISEANGAVMADTIGRITKKPAVLLTTAGPGATNAISGIAQAYSANSPLLHISATLPSNAPKDAFHGLDDPRFLEKIFSNVTKASFLIDNAKDVPKIFANAYTLSISGFMGPVHIGVVDKILDQYFKYDEKFLINIGNTGYESYMISIDKVVDKIINSKNVILYVGKNVIRYSAEEEIVELAKLIKAIVVVPRHYPDSYPNDYPEYAGSIGEFSHPAAVIALRNADLVISLGIKYDSLEDRNLKKYYKGEIIYIDAERGEAPFGIFGNIKYILKDIINNLKRYNINKLDNQLINNIIIKIKEDLNNQLNNIINIKNYINILNPGLVLKLLNEVVPPNTIITGDAGLVGGAWLNDVFKFKKVGTFLHPRNYDGMGFAIPSAIAASLVYKDRPIIAITGDGSFLVSLSEISLCNKLSINPKFLIFNDSKLGMIWQEQVSRGDPILATEFPYVSISSIGNALGIKSIKIDSYENLKEKLYEIVYSNEPLLVEILSDSSILPPSRTMWKKMLDKLEYT